MKMTICIEFDAAWVLSRREDDVLPAAALASALGNRYKLTVENESPIDLTLTLDTENSFESVKRDALSAFEGMYGAEFLNCVKISAAQTEESASDEEPSFEASSEDDDDPESILRELFGIVAEERKGKSESEEQRSESEEDEPEKNKPEKSKPDNGAEAVIDEMRALACSYELVQLAEEMTKVVPKLVERGLDSVFLSRSYLFSIGDGCGFTTSANLFAKLMRTLGLKCAEFVREYKLPPYNEKPDVLDGTIEWIERPSSTSNRAVLALDISEWMNKTDNIHFRELLRAIEANHDYITVMFRIPFVDRELCERICTSLNDVLTVNPISFPPASREQIMAFVKDELKKRGFSIRQAALEQVWIRITEEKSDGRYYGMKTVKKVLDELVYGKLLKESGSKKGGSVITEGDAAALVKSGSASLKTGQQMLDELVGNENIKRQVEEIIAQIRVARLASDDPPCIHMRFVGNPGTGKTTVARIIGKILKENGILRIGNFIEVGGRDLCGKYIGETAPKTAGICRDAYGSVLFIDEAYSLYRGNDDTRDFGREALDTLIAEMENHRGDLVVIMAGYTDDMERLMQGNRGLSSRMPYKVEFPNFTSEQLYEIFRSMLNSKFKHDADIEEAAKQYFESLPKELLESKEFSNGRFVRNLYERVRGKAALRCQFAGASDIVLTRKDFELAIAEKDFAVAESQRTKVGFY